MANHKQALKRHRQSQERRTRNRALKRRMANTVKALEKTAESGSAEEKAAALTSTVSLIARVAAKGVIPKKRASRKISRLMKANKP